MGGLEVEELRPVAPPFSMIVVGEIKEAVQHPTRGSLRVCQVDVGQASLLNIVCGAPNERAGIKVPCALVGARQLPLAKTANLSRSSWASSAGGESQGMPARHVNSTQRDHGGFV